MHWRLTGFIVLCKRRRRPPLLLLCSEKDVSRPVMRRPRTVESSAPQPPGGDSQIRIQPGLTSLAARSLEIADFGEAHETCGEETNAGWDK